MALDVVELIHPAVLYIRYSGIWSMEDLAEGNRRSLLVADQTDRPFYFLVDARATTAFPLNAMAVAKVSTILKHPRIKWTITVNNLNPAFNMISQIVCHLVNMRLKNVNRMEDALEFLKILDEELTDVAVPDLQLS